MAPGCTGNLFVGCDCGGPGKPGVYWFSKEDAIEEGAPFTDSGIWKCDYDMETDWSHSFINCTQHLATLLANDQWFDDTDFKPIKAENGRYILATSLAIIRSLRSDGREIAVKDIKDAP